jgi:hypothetical protein
MTEQPEALADVLCSDAGNLLIYRQKAAAELRRLHALNGELLEALEQLVIGTEYEEAVATEKIITALRAALEQPEQAEPVAWLYRHKTQPWKQATVVQRMDHLRGSDEWHEVPLYTRPPRRETEPAAFDALVAISLLTHLGGEVADYADVVDAVRRLHALNGELLEALKALCESHSRFSGGVWDKARAAIRARGQA